MNASEGAVLTARVTLVTCANCGNENKATAKFCAECGILLTRACPACAAAVRPGQRFCDECGTPLSSPPGSEGGTTDREPAISSSAVLTSTGQLAERRVVRCKVV